jgi:uncharacterized integral membrane protein
MVIRKTLLDSIYKLSQGWLIFSVILIIFSFFRMANDDSISLSLMIGTLFITASIGTAPYAIIKFIRKDKNKKTIGKIQ